MFDLHISIYHKISHTKRLSLHYNSYKTFCPLNNLTSKYNWSERPQAGQLSKSFIIMDISHFVSYVI